MNISLAIIMFGVDLDLRLADFKYIWNVTKAFFLGLLSLIYLFTLIDLALNLADTKTLTIENGIQNSGLALVLNFQLFRGFGGGIVNHCRLVGASGTLCQG